MSVCMPPDVSNANSSVEEDVDPMHKLHQPDARAGGGLGGAGGGMAHQPYARAGGAPGETTH